MTDTEYKGRIDYQFSGSVSCSIRRRLCRTFEITSDCPPDILLNHAAEMKHALELVRKAFGGIRELPCHPHIIPENKLTALRKVNRVLNRLIEETEIDAVKLCRTEQVDYTAVANCNAFNRKTEN